MELGAAPQQTMAPEPLSLLISAAPESPSGQSDGDSVGAIRGGANEPLSPNDREREEVFPMGWGMEVRPALKIIHARGGGAREIKGERRSERDREGDRGVQGRLSLVRSGVVRRGRGGLAAVPASCVSLCT